MKKLLTAGLVAVMAMALAGCAPEEEPAAVTETPSANDVVVEIQPEPLPEVLPEPEVEPAE